MGLARGLGASGVLLAVASGCSTTATVHHWGGAMFEGEIQGGTPDGIIVEPNVGRRREIPRREIKDIDHPGNVHALVGSFVLVMGIQYAAMADDCRREQTNWADCAVVVTPAAVGAGLLGWGLVTWFGSKSAAADTSMLPIEPEAPRGPRREPSPKREMLPPAPPPPDAAPASPPTPAPTGSSPLPPAPPSSAVPPPAPPPAEPSPGGVNW